MLPLVKLQKVQEVLESHTQHMERHAYPSQVGRVMLASHGPGHLRAQTQLFELMVHTSAGIFGLGGLLTGSWQVLELEGKGRAGWKHVAGRAKRKLP